MKARGAFSRFHLRVAVAECVFIYVEWLLRPRVVEEVVRDA
jgi:hypothetical protein